MSGLKISGVVITFNESRNIRRCLDSMQGVVDEIVVVDSFSTDDTALICQQYGVRFVQNAFKGHIEQKNFAISCAAYPSILSLDADEALSEELKKSILEIKNSNTCDAYSMNRLTNYCGQWIHHSGWYPDRKVRLFDRNKAHWGGINPHDKIEVEKGGKIGHLSGDLLHYSYYSVEEHIERSKKYADIAALAMHQKGRKANLFHLVFSPPFKFVRDYFFKLGFLDGMNGLRICYISALVNFWKYKKLRTFRGGIPAQK